MEGESLHTHHPTLTQTHWRLELKEDHKSPLRPRQEEDHHVEMDGQPDPIRGEEFFDAPNDQRGSIICVGGDGIVNEVLNGLLCRTDQKEAISIPIGIIPASSDNSLAWTVLGVRDPISAAIAIVKVLLKDWLHLIELLS
nr:sphingoid long-chain bases kinase 1-like isoform X1 [Ipomoea trifida]